MAYYVGHHPLMYNWDIWSEETSQWFQEFSLSSNSIPIDGRIHAMYHGTTFSAAVKILQNGFKQSEDGMLGRGVYVTRDKEKAMRYPLDDKTDQVVLRLRVNVGRVIMINQQNHSYQKTWHDHNYDTAWVPSNCGMVESGLEEDCVWDPRRIKVMGFAYISPALQVTARLLSAYLTQGPI